jgi:hypothetical protein
MELKRLSGAGEIKKGAPLLLEMRTGEIVPATAKKVLFPGDFGEEIIYRKRKNHYFITSMVVDGTSHVRNVWIVVAPQEAVES